ncbi:Transporter, ABC superfamily (Breast cancer resistance protein) [Handroanthus impetiginosus]|uniref:Transporter, ABC superfamily (Breast cancer resistance protein) n=1 Tax=Handroanthus impetiginosus TaxID=429701 RepID=A0A2G9G9S5_9LAMI|nr:Transporter, ABC superfamily (Breast cancer resistance protein) [Handroanthus impetiginosus]
MLVSGEAADAASPNGGRNSKQISLRDQISHTSSPITLKFMDVSYRVKLHENNAKSRTIMNAFAGRPTPSTDVENPAAVQERTILNGITGMAEPGHVLAILGPSGSGKSTLLNALAGRLHHGHGLTGTVLFNNRKITKQVLKKTGFVAQDDVLYPHLTVRETLVFCSLLRLPNSLPKTDKIAVAESIISEVGLSKCEHTIIGNSFIRGISGGERKRVSIAHEMLVDPSLLILDEPTSGLDATAAYRLVATLGGLAAKGKTVVTSVHQPSSRVFQMFDDLLVLSEGRCIYFGKGSEAMAYFESVGFSPSFPMNPADFMLDLANGVCHLDGSTERERPNVRQTLVSSYNNVLAPKVKSACMDAQNTVARERTIVGNRTTKRYKCMSCLSTWLNQFTILLQRNLKERKHETFNSLRVFQVIAASLLAGFMWWHSDYQDIQDRLGLLFFISIFWGVFPSFNAVFAFPQERAIFMKEKASGMYSLSSYFMARITSDLPMELILPTLFLSITYWMTGLKPELSSFVLTLIVVLGYVLVSQGLGLLLGALIMDAKQASTVVTVTMLAFVLTGGYYVHKVPSFMSWIKYVSTTFYSYRLLINVQYGEGESISSLLGCSTRKHDRATCKFINEDISGQIHPAMSACILLIMFVGYRLLAYIALRRI